MRKNPLFPDNNSSIFTSDDPGRFTCFSPSNMDDDLALVVDAPGFIQNDLVLPSVSGLATNHRQHSPIMQSTTLNRAGDQWKEESLKKTCESCVKLKVRCSGTHPCLRCTRSNRQCQFLPRKPRILTRPYKKRKKPTSDSTPITAVDNTQHSKRNCEKKREKRKICFCSSEDFIGRFIRPPGLPNPLQVKKEQPDFNPLAEETAVIDPVTFERYSLSMAEVAKEEFMWDLYSQMCKHYLHAHTSNHMFLLFQCSIKSLRDHFSKFYGFRAEIINSDVETLLIELQVNSDAFFESRGKFMTENQQNRQQISTNMVNEFSLISRFREQSDRSRSARIDLPSGAELSRINKHFFLACRTEVVQMLSTFYGKKPIALIRTRSMDMCNSLMRPVDVVLNPAFKNIFKMDEHEICKNLVTRASGFLPFGSALLAQLCSNYAELLTFLEVQCVKGTVVDIFGTCPAYSEMPNVSVMSLNIGVNQCSEEFHSKRFQVTSIVRRLQDDKSIIEETLFEFFSVENIPLS